MPTKVKINHYPLNLSFTIEDGLPPHDPESFVRTDILRDYLTENVSDEDLNKEPDEYVVEIVTSTRKVGDVIHETWVVGS